MIRLGDVEISQFLAINLPHVSPDLPGELFIQTAPRSQRAVRTTDRLVAAQASSKEPDLPEVGAIVDKFKLEAVLGIGGFGVVYRARHLILDTHVAIKLMRPSVAKLRPTLSRLLREEARFAARIDHKHVVRVLDVESGEFTYIVMEYVDGPDLSVMIKRRGGLPAKMVVRVIRHVTEALQAGLAENIIHRDIKPSNILLTRDGVTKLTDFGLARSSSSAIDDGGARGVVGTVGYMSPEQLQRPKEVDFRTDIYSLGVTAYQALTGRLPFNDSNFQRSSDAHLFEQVPPLPSNIHSGLRDLVMWMLAKQRDHRPASYEELDAAARQLVRP
ncbi:MAG TPA: serine/threonine-protein kinase [Kofleriaceae bacterium]